MNRWDLALSSHRLSREARDSDLDESFLWCRGRAVYHIVCMRLILHSGPIGSQCHGRPAWRVLVAITRTTRAWPNQKTTLGRTDCCDRCMWRQERKPISKEPKVAMMHVTDTPNGGRYPWVDVIKVGGNPIAIPSLWGYTSVCYPGLACHLRDSHSGLNGCAWADT